MSRTYDMRVYVFVGTPDPAQLRAADLAICNGVIVKDRHGVTRRTRSWAR